MARSYLDLKEVSELGSEYPCQSPAGLTPAVATERCAAAPLRCMSSGRASPALARRPHGVA